MELNSSAMSKLVLDNNASSSKSSNGDPPELRINCLSMRDVKAKTKDPKDTNLPVDVLLLTVKNCEFLACYNELQDPYKCWFDGLGYVYFSHVDQSQEEKVKVALLRCYKNGIGPGGSLISVKNAASKLRPKAVISVGACTGLNPNKTKLGDVIVSAKLTTYQGRSTSLKSCVSRRFLDIIKDASCEGEWMLFPLVILLHSSSPFIFLALIYLFSVVVKAFYFKITGVNVCWRKRVWIFQVLELLFAFHTLQQMLRILGAVRLFSFLFNQNNQSNGI